MRELGVTTEVDEDDGGAVCGVVEGTDGCVVEGDGTETLKRCAKAVRDESRLRNTVLNTMLLTLK